LGATHHKASQRHAYERFETVRLAADPYDSKPIWQNFRGLFHAIDEGNLGLNIPACNGGLFAADPALDALQVPDGVSAHFNHPPHRRAGSGRRGETPLRSAAPAAGDGSHRHPGTART
jgi:hypothetical protein